jgi:hypothetical protein
MLFPFPRNELSSFHDLIQNQQNNFFSCFGLSFNNLSRYSKDFILVLVKTELMNTALFYMPVVCWFHFLEMNYLP